MKIKIPEEVINMLIPEFLMKELSDLEHCTEECKCCCVNQNSNGKLSNVCLFLQLTRAEDKISKFVPQVFEFLNSLRLAQRTWTTQLRPMPNALHEAFPAFTVQQCNKLFEAWALYTAKYEDPIDKDSLAIRFRYYPEYQVKDRILSAHVVEYWDRDALEWKRQDIYFFSDTNWELAHGENMEERSRFLTFLLGCIRNGYKVKYIPGVFKHTQPEEDD